MCQAIRRRLGHWEVKKEGRKSYGGGFGIFSTVSRPSVRQVCEPFERCCSCTRTLTCSTTGPSARAWECLNAGRQYTGFNCWVRCKNRGRIILSPITARGLLGHFLHGVDSPTVNQRASPPPVQSPIFLSLREISAAGTGQEGAWGGASGCRSLRDGRGGERGAGGRYRYGLGTTCDTEGADRETMEATVATETAVGGRRRNIKEPPARRKENGAWGKYRTGGRGTEESTDISAKWNG